ncbi:MAG: hypothetical protein C0490_24875 [Marivirga sp.]|nr:hypothetical protein [Marivirga sp.]
MIARSTTLTFLTVLFVNIVSAQQGSFKVIAEIPVQIGIGYEGRLNNRLSVDVSAGLLAPPNSSIIVEVLNVLGTDEVITLIIEDAFKVGIVGTVGCNYNFKRNYVGSFLQLLSLHAGDAPSDLIESYFSTSIDSYPSKKRTNSSTEKYLSLSSSLWQAGVLYGRRFPLKNKRLELDTEIGISANISSKSKLTSDERNLSALSDVVDAELAGYYSNYAFVPSISVALVYKLAK